MLVVDAEAFDRAVAQVAHLEAEVKRLRQALTEAREEMIFLHRAARAARDQLRALGIDP